jgi:hypothetical protein
MVDVNVYKPRIVYLFFFSINLNCLEQLKKNAIQSTNELTDSITEYVNDGYFVNIIV